MDAIRRLATGEVALRGDNHVLPVLHWIEFAPVLHEIAFPKMTFAVFPLMSGSEYVPWFHDYHEVFEYIKQVLQVSLMTCLDVSSGSYPRLFRAFASATTAWSHISYVVPKFMST